MIMKAMERKASVSMDDCTNNHAKLVSFDPVAAKGLTSEEIQKRWPRVVCSECKTMLYASADHLMAGNW